MNADERLKVGHPKGTLAVLILYMLLFMAGWAGLYFFTFLPRGTPDADVRSSAVEHATPREVEP